MPAPNSQSSQTQPQQPIQNHYHRRLVAPDRARACYICHKSTPVVLITPDSRDFFYICAGHLKDTGFASPVTDTPEPQAAADSTAKDEEIARKVQDEELQREIDNVVKEYNDKQKRRKERRKNKKKKKEERDKDGKRMKDDDDDFPSGDEDKEREEKERKVKELERKKSKSQNADASGAGKDEVAKNGGVKKEEDEGPRVFTLHKSIFAMRVNRMREAQMAKRRQEQMSNGTLFPSVPRAPLR